MKVEGRLVPVLSVKLSNREPVSKCSILFESKEGENFNRRNTLSISRIKI